MSSLNQYFGLADPMPARPEPIHVEFIGDQSVHTFNELVAMELERTDDHKIARMDWITLARMVEIYGWDQITDQLVEIRRMLDSRKG